MKKKLEAQIPIAVKQTRYSALFVKGVPHIVYHIAPFLGGFPFGKHDHPKYVSSLSVAHKYFLLYSVWPKAVCNGIFSLHGPTFSRHPIDISEHGSMNAARPEIQTSNAENVEENVDCDNLINDIQI